MSLSEYQMQLNRTNSYLRQLEEEEEEEEEEERKKKFLRLLFLIVFLISLFSNFSLCLSHYVSLNEQLKQNQYTSPFVFRCLSSHTSPNAFLLSHVTSMIA